MITYKFEYIQYQILTNKSLMMKRILNQATIHIKMGMITAITGKSGSGKTSIMYRLGLIENTLGDRYFFNDQEIDLSNEDLKSDYRGRKISFVYQDNNLLNDLTLQDNFDIFNRMIFNFIKEIIS